MVRENIAAFGNPGNVPISLARDLINTSAIWKDHPQGIINAPAWSDHIEKGPDGWEVDFKGNYFLVERAILLCKRTIIEELDHAQKSSQPISRKVLYRRLITCVRKSVANGRHEPYDYYTGGASDELKRQGKSQGYYTADSMLRSASEGKFAIITIDTKRYGLTPQSKDVWKGFMKFGVHAIQVKEFVERIWQLAGLETVEQTE